MKLHPPQIPLSISWLGEAKTAWKAQEAAKARPSQAVVATLFQGRLKVVAGKGPARGQALNKRKTMQGKQWRGEYDEREKG